MLIGMVCFHATLIIQKIWIIVLFAENRYGMFQSYGVGSSLLVSSTGKFEGLSEEQATIKVPRFFICLII